jgi:small subunit ribosomal protein S1
MVNKNFTRESKGGPPPMDESWWEAVMAEDEALNNSKPVLSYPSRSSATVQAATRRPLAEVTLMDWDRAIDLYEQDDTVNLLVTGCNRGGLLVEGEGLQGFVPLSHLVEMVGQKTEEEQEEWLASYIGQELALKVIECDQDRGRVVFSERAALAEPGSRNELLQNLTAGECIPGTVTNVTDFGVFVDLGGVEGLIHVSEISWGRVRHPSDVVRLGQPVQVYVINVDQDRAGVALSIKRLYPNPWETAEERYHTGQIIEATITSIVPFGAFARLEEGLDGLIHISEVCVDGNPALPGDCLEEGQVVKVRVLHVDGPRQRLGLSLRLEECNEE